MCRLYFAILSIILFLLFLPFPSSGEEMSDGYLEDAPDTGAIL